MVAELTDLNRNLMMSIDVVPIPTDEAVREAESRLLGVETNITNWQRRQNSNNNFSAIAVFKTAVYTGSENEFRYYQFVDAATKEQFDGYIQRAKEKAFYDTGVSAEYGDKLITLSTCEYSGQNSRLVVVAKRVTESGGSNAPSNDGATEIQS